MHIYDFAAENGTDVPFSLKMVIVNNGTGAVNGLKVESARLSLLSWSTRNAVRCLIHKALTDGEIRPKTFELQLGTIAPSRTVLVHWLLMCQEATVFDNLTLSFVQLNSKGWHILRYFTTFQLFDDVRSFVVCMYFITRRIDAEPKCCR